MNGGVAHLAPLLEGDTGVRTEGRRRETSYMLIMYGPFFYSHYTMKFSYIIYLGLHGKIFGKKYVASYKGKLMKVPLREEITASPPSPL